MEKDFLERLVKNETQLENNTKELENHDKRIEDLEHSTAILQKMDLRMGNVEKSVDTINNKLDSKLTEADKKKADWLDYIFKGIVTIVIGYIAVKLGLQ